MSISKLQKLDPSAIDKCAMVFVPPLAREKEEIEAFFDNDFFHGAFVNPCMM